MCEARGWSVATIRITAALQRARSRKSSHGSTRSPGLADSFNKSVQNCSEAFEILVTSALDTQSANATRNRARSERTSP